MLNLLAGGAVLFRLFLYSPIIVPWVGFVHGCVFYFSVSFSLVSFSLGVVLCLSIAKRGFGRWKGVWGKCGAVERAGSGSGFNQGVVLPAGPRHLWGGGLDCR